MVTSRRSGSKAPCVTRERDNEVVSVSSEEKIEATGAGAIGRGRGYRAGREGSEDVAWGLELTAMVPEASRRASRDRYLPSRVCAPGHDESGRRPIGVQIGGTGTSGPLRQPAQFETAPRGRRDGAMGCLCLETDGGREAAEREKTGKNLKLVRGTPRRRPRPADARARPSREISSFPAHRPPSSRRTEPLTNPSFAPNVRYSSG